MIRNDVLHWFILGFGLEFPDDRHLGRSTNITQLWLSAKEKCFDCEVLDALHTLRREHAELKRYEYEAAGEWFEPVSFETIRNIPEWTDFFMTSYFNIIVESEGRVHYQRLSEQLRRELPPPEPLRRSIGFVP
jgi:hypothetical protein